ncbi:unnamed protein product [Nippostrongylus brasiliensis]|uniref:Glycosyltransferase family 17 n=1 Tax=Nippostrongylus brasiliensis TaxID=27835 RepID=A0A158QWK9_NIPBR|nr:unnamed protein product [Nippostrongylus brasiliensis]
MKSKNSADFQFSSSKYIIITDYEHLFSEGKFNPNVPGSKSDRLIGSGFEAKVRAIAARRLVEKPHTMLVYRIFEIDEKIKQMPRDKSALYKLFLAESAVVFHARYYPGAHEIDGLLEWFQKNSSSDGLSVKNLSYDRSNWEPQFVSLAQIPFHDENFPFQLRDNTVLRWEMCRANYSIDVLDDVFMFHRGIKGKSSGERSRAVQKENSAKFEVALKRFIERMDREYPATKKKCPAPER